MEWFGRLKLGTPVFDARKEGNEPTCCPHSCIFAEYHSQLCIVNWNPITETKKKGKRPILLDHTFSFATYYYVQCTV